MPDLGARDRRAHRDHVVPRGTLRRLDEHGLINRTVYPAVPLHVEYSLGRDAGEPLPRRWVVDNTDRVPGQVLSDPPASVGA
ncbi:winged helix-turn-helix transcriptional regulator [Actinoplanes sp. NPDC049599]|uniref:winged helix-turn-helix transcriptional regulator n=1 Tax=Actinoplanes sp. NPDC049599 TaxID=3363903 RepID=UPI003794C314